MSENTQKKARSIEMVTGSLWKNIILFSIPLMCSQLLEVLFNLSDVAVVGRFADYKALGAVGSTTLLVTLFVGFLIVIVLIVGALTFLPVLALGPLAEFFTQLHVLG